MKKYTDYRTMFLASAVLSIASFTAPMQSLAATTAAPNDMTLEATDIYQHTVTITPTAGFDITSVTAGDTWIQVDYTAGDVVFTYTLDPNNIGVLRNGEITVTASNGSEEETCTVRVAQLPAEQVFAYREIDASSVEIIGYRWAGAIDSYAHAIIPTHIGYQDTERVVTWVNSDTFNHEKGILKYVSYPNTVTEIASDTFRDCSVLEEVDLPSIVNIEAKAFNSCPELKTVKMPLVQTIGESAFEGCAKLVDVQMMAMQDIGVKAFKDCKSLTTLGETEYLTKIQDRAFSGCESLPYFDISAVTDFGIYVFEDCYSLEAVKMAPDVTTIKEGTFYNCKSLVRIGDVIAPSAQESFDLPLLVTDIELYAFYGCESLQLVNMPAVVTIGESAFENCIGMIDFSIPEVTDIGAKAFKNCTSLVGGDLQYANSTIEALFIPNQVETIRDEAFANCTSLRTVSIGNYATYTTGFTTNANVIPALESIGSKAFANCPALRSIYFYGFQPATIADDVFDDTKDVISYFLYSKSSYTWCNPPYHRNGAGDFVTVDVPATGTRDGMGNSDIFAGQNVWVYDEKAVVLYSKRPTKVWRLPQIITSELPETITATEVIGPISDKIYSNSGLPVTVVSSDSSVVAVVNNIVDAPNGENTGTLTGVGLGNVTLHTYQDGLNYDNITDNRWTVISDFAPFASRAGDGDFPLTGVKAQMTITAADATKAYAGAIDYAPAPFHAEYTIGSVVTDCTAEIAVEFASEGEAATANVGTYPLNIANATSETLDLTAFTITEVPGTLTVTQAPLTIAAKDQTQVEGEAPIKEYETTPNPLFNGDAIVDIDEEYTYDDVTKTGTLDYRDAVIERDGADVTANYDITYTTGTITFDPLATTIIVTPISDDLPQAVVEEIITLPYADKNGDGEDIVVTRTFNVEANGIWFAKANDDWITLDPVKGTAGNTPVDFTATINETAIRDTTIEVYNTLGLVVKLTVIQSAKDVDAEWEWIVVNPEGGVRLDDSDTPSDGYIPTMITDLSGQFVSLQKDGTNRPVDYITKYNGTDTSVIVPTVLGGHIVAAFADANDKDHGTFTESPAESLCFDAVLKLAGIGDNTFAGSKVGSTFSLDDISGAAATFSKFVVPSTVYYIGDSAFENCINLENITFEDAFFFFKADDPAQEIVPDLPDGRAKKADGYADSYNAFAVTTYNDGRPSEKAPVLRAIGDRAFAGCTGLNSAGTPNDATSNYLLIPREVVSIGVNAFDCENLQEIYFLGTAPYTPGTPMGTYTDALPCFEPASFGTARPTINYLPYYSVWRRDTDGFAWFPTYAGRMYASWENIIALNYDGTYDKVWAGFEFSTWRIAQRIQGVNIDNATPVTDGFEVLFGTVGVKAVGIIGADQGIGTDHIIYTSNNPTVAAIDATTGDITLNAVGDTIITASRADDGIYAEARAMTILTVKPAIVTILPREQALRFPINNVATNTFDVGALDYVCEPATAPVPAIAGTTVGTTATPTSAIGDYPITVVTEGTIADSNYVFATTHETNLLLILGAEDSLHITALDQWKWEGKEIDLSAMTPSFEATIDGAPTTEVTGVTLHSDGEAASATTDIYPIVPSDVQPIVLTTYYVPNYHNGYLEVRDGADDLTIDPASQAVSCAGGNFTFDVRPDSANALWMFESAPAWVTVTSRAGSPAVYGDEENPYMGSVTFDYTVAPLEAGEPRRSGEIVAYSWASDGSKIVAKLTVRQSDGNTDFWVGFAEPDVTIVKDEIEVTKYVGANTVVVVPEVLEDNPNHRGIMPNDSGTVIGIGTTAFYNRTDVTSITLPATVTYIKDWAFAYCDALASFNSEISASDASEVPFDFILPANITSVGKYAFAYSANIKNARIDNLAVLGEGLFNADTGLEYVYVGTPIVEELQKWAFFGCVNLKSIEFAGDLLVDEDGNIHVDTETFKYCGTEDDPLVLITNGSEGWLKLKAQLEALDINVVVKIAQTIDFPAIGDLTYGDYPETDGVFSSGASSSAGQPVTLVVEPAGILEVQPPTAPGDAPSLRIVGTGDVTITAKQDGDESHMPAENVAQTLNVAKATLEIKANAVPATVEYGEEMPDFSLQIDGLAYAEDDEDVIEGVITVDCDYEVGTPAGTVCSFVPNVSAASAQNYDFLTIDGQFTVVPHTTVITWADQVGYANVAVNSDYQPVELLCATADAIGTITYWDGANQIVPETTFGPGIFEITAKFAPVDANYTAAERNVWFNIEQASLQALVPPTIAVPRTGGQYTVEVIANADWDVACDVDWITIDSVEVGIGIESLEEIFSGKVTYTVAPAVEQAERIGTITVSTIIPGPMPQTLEVSQIGIPYIRVFGDDPVVEYDEEDVVIVPIEANILWTLGDVNSDWIINPQSMVELDNSGYVRFNVLKNEDTENARIGSFTLISDDDDCVLDPVVVTVTQLPAASLALSESFEAVGAEAGSGVVSVLSNRDDWTFTVSADADWLTVTRDGNNLAYSYTAREFTDRVDRSAEITVTLRSETAVFSLTQDGFEPYVFVTPMLNYVDAAATEIELSVAASSYWDEETVSISADWISADYVVVELDNTGKILLSIAENTLNSVRQGEVSVSITDDVTGDVLTGTALIIQDTALPHTITIEPAETILNAEETVVDFVVTSTFYWDPDDVQVESWMSIDEVIVEADNCGIIKVRVANNVGGAYREGSVTVVATDEITLQDLTATATIAQYGHVVTEIVATPALASVPATETVVVFEISANDTWDWHSSISAPATWCVPAGASVNPDGKSGTFKFKVKENTTGAARDVDIYFYAEGLFGSAFTSVTVSQAAVVPDPEISYVRNGDELVISFEGGSLYSSTDAKTWDLVDGTIDGKFTVNMSDAQQMFFMVK